MKKKKELKLTCVDLNLTESQVQMCDISITSLMCQCTKCALHKLYFCGYLDQYDCVYDTTFNVNYLDLEDKID